MFECFARVDYLSVCALLVEFGQSRCLSLALVRSYTSLIASWTLGRLSESTALFPPSGFFSVFFAMLESFLSLAVSLFFFHRGDLVPVSNNMWISLLCSSLSFLSPLVWCPFSVVGQCRIIGGLLLVKSFRRLVIGMFCCWFALQSTASLPWLIVILLCSFFVLLLCTSYRWIQVVSVGCIGG